MTSTEDVLNEIEENSLQIISAAKKVAKIFSFIPFDDFVECTRIPYIVRKSLMEPDPWGTLEVVLKKREEPFRGGIQRPPLSDNIRWAYNKPKGY
jgi:hypothetical protein